MKPKWGCAAAWHGVLAKLAHASYLGWRRELMDPQIAGGHEAMGLSADGGLFYGGAMVAQQVTSAAVWGETAAGPSYLLYTTKDNFLHTFALADLASNSQDRLQQSGARSVRSVRFLCCYAISVRARL